MSGMCSHPCEITNFMWNVYKIIFYRFVNTVVMEAANFSVPQDMQIKCLANDCMYCGISMQILIDKSNFHNPSERLHPDLF